jgi:gas vesicle protein
MRKLFSFLLGLLTGALVGAAIAMLLAPEAGEMTRQGIQLRMDQIVEEGKRAAAERRTELESQLEELKRGKAPAPQS